MKVSAFTLPERFLVAGVAAAYAAAHLPFVAPSLEDIDSINFALGLRDFDPALHQPHPPGYPVYIALGRVLLSAVATLAPGMPAIRAEALTLGLLAVAGATAALIAAFLVFKSVWADAPGPARAAAAGATLVLAAIPLFWMSGLRPLSDTVGLAVALASQALALRGQRDPRRLTQAALVAGLAAGVRVQTTWLTLPVLAFAALRQRRAGLLWLLSRPGAALAAGLLIWAVPLVAASGGVNGYLNALGTQAGEDFAWVDMVWLDPTPRRLAFAVYHTFVVPFASIPLAAVVAAAAAAGALVMVVRERSALLLLAIAFGPYVVLHLLFQETFTVRYALPVLPLLAALVARAGVQAGGAGVAALAGVAAWALVVAVPGGVAYGREAHPAFRALADGGERAAAEPPAAVYSHFALRRVFQADARGLPYVEPRRSDEWLGPVEYWRHGGTRPIWFFADPMRTDLALIDPHSRRDVMSYQWAVAERPEVTGSRPLGADWYRMQPPGWFAGQGWSLTPETGGLARLRALGPDHRPIEAWVRRRSTPVHLVVGGRHLGDAGDPAAAFELALDGVVRDRWTLTVDERNFLRFLDLPEGIAAGPGEYASLTIRAVPAGTDTRRPPVAIRQFDVQPADVAVYGFGEGWHEAEYDVRTGVQWRWTSDRSVLRIKGSARDVRLRIRGESPLRYFDQPPTVRVVAGGRMAGEFQPRDDFDWTVVVPATDVERGGGTIALEVDRVYLPGEAEGTSDTRRLGLKLYECELYPLQP